MWRGPGSWYLQSTMTMTPTDRRLLEAKMRLERTATDDPTVYGPGQARPTEDPVGPGRQGLVFRVLNELGFSARDLVPGWSGPSVAHGAVRGRV